MTTRTVVFRIEAENELNEIALYINRQSGLTLSQQYVDRIYAACQRLTYFPNRGRPRNDIAPGLRTIAFERRVTIAYRVLDTHVEIVSIAYGGRDLERELRKPK